MTSVRVAQMANKPKTQMYSRSKYDELVALTRIGGGTYTKKNSKNTVYAAICTHLNGRPNCARVMSQLQVLTENDNLPGC